MMTKSYYIILVSMKTLRNTQVKMMIQMVSYEMNVYHI